jgi:exopolyphosphatase / guanosine-5'-triphosphate,3'-diphosphate pyrophosphatase
MDKIVPRWEWRAFAADFGLAEARLAKLSPESEQEGEEVYLLAAVTDKTVKIRDGLLDVKSLERVDRAGLEQWRPAMKAAFPLSPADVERLFAMMRLASPDAEEPDYTLDELYDELEDCGCAEIVPLHKRRRHYTIAGCMAELTDVRLSGREDVRTVAVESEDAERVVAALEYLGLSRCPNTSYPRWLAAEAGIDIQP